MLTEHEVDIDKNIESKMRKILDDSGYIPWRFQVRIDGLHVYCGCKFYEVKNYEQFCKKLLPHVDLKKYANNKFQDDTMRRHTVEIEFVPVSEFFSNKNKSRIGSSDLSNYYYIDPIRYFTPAEMKYLYKDLPTLLIKECEKRTLSENFDVGNSRDNTVGLIVESIMKRVLDNYR